MTPRFVRIAGLLAAAACIAGWWLWEGGEDRAIRQRLHALRGAVNESAPEGLATVARAAEIGSFFTADVTIDFGAGSSPLHGREAVIGMAARLQPQTGAYQVDVDDIEVTTIGEDSAEVSLTATFARRSVATGDESLDAREFAVLMSKSEGDWRIARATVVQALKREP